MLFVAIQFDFIVQVDDFAIHPGADETGLADFLENGLVRPFASAHHRGQNQNPLAFGQFLNRFNNLLRRLLDDDPPANRAMRNADSGIQKPQVVINFGNGTHRRAWIVTGRFLVDGHSRGKAVDVVHIRLVHLPDELARIGRKRFDITTLALGKNRIKRQRRLARAGKTGNDHQFIARDFDGDIFQIVLARANDTNDIR